MILNTKRFGYNPGFAMTFYKIQGLTMKKLIMLVQYCLQYYQNISEFVGFILIIFKLNLSYLIN